MNAGVLLSIPMLLMQLPSIANGDSDSQGPATNGAGKAVASLGRMGATVRTTNGAVTYVYFADQRLSDADLTIFGDLRDLEILNLMDCKVDDAIFRYVKRMPRLVELSLWGSNITDDGLENLKGHRLKSLDLRRTGIGDAGLAHLREMKSLQKLDLLQTRVTDNGLRYVANLTEMQELCLVATRVGDRGLEHISGLTKLTELSLEDTKVTAQGLKHLANFVELRLLTLHRTKINDESLAPLSRMKHLSTLYLCDTPISDKGLETLVRLKSLETVYINGTRISEAGREALHRALPNTIIEW